MVQTDQEDSSYRTLVAAGQVKHSFNIYSGNMTLEYISIYMYIIYVRLFSYAFVNCSCNITLVYSGHFPLHDLIDTEEEYCKANGI